MDMKPEDIDVVRTMMAVVDKACLQQDPDTEIARKCIGDMLDKVSLPQWIFTIISTRILICLV